MKITRHTIGLISLFLLLQSCGYTPADAPNDVCSALIKQTQYRDEARNEQLVTEMINFLSNKTLAELNPIDADSANALADSMRTIFIENREIAYTLNGSPIPITAGSGFGTVDSEGNAENLFGIYQANTPSGACNYPFAPVTALPIDLSIEQIIAGVDNSNSVPFVSSKIMNIACKFLSDCKKMEHPLFLNTSNIELNGTKNKLFFDGGKYDMEHVAFKTFKEWHPGGVANDVASDVSSNVPINVSTDTNNWVALGWLNYLNGDKSGHYVIYKQADMQQYVLLYYRPFEDVSGEFAGVAYAFVNLYEEYLANETFSLAVEEGVCTAPPRNCSTGE